MRAVAKQKYGATRQEVVTKVVKIRKWIGNRHLKSWELNYRGMHK